MCLAVQYHGKSLETFGYKVLLKDEDGRYFTGIARARQTEIPHDGWAETPKELNPTAHVEYSDTHYEQAFHICLNKQEALEILAYEGRKDHLYPLVLCQVQFDDEVAWGETHWFWDDLRPREQSYSRTVVARKCRVVQEVA